MADAPSSMDVIVSAARAALTASQEPEPEVLDAVEHGLATVEAPLSAVPHPAAAIAGAGPLTVRRRPA